MNYQQTLDYLYSQLPMYQRIGPAAYKANLDNTLALAKHLGNPENQFRSIHVAGTNGKGSVSHLLASVFQEAGYKTGLCTSPHLKDFRERFRINGAMIPEDFITSFVVEHMAFFQSIQPSFFEMTIAMAFQWFALEKVDIAIIETGLGGRLDSTNIITPEISVITNVGLDHVSLLGNTIEEIAAEKAGIIKRSVPVVLGKSRDAARNVCLQKATEKQAPVYPADEMCAIATPQFLFDGKGNRILKGTLELGMSRIEFQCPLSGTYQLENICTAASAAWVITMAGRYCISETHIARGFQNVIANTGMAGRWQVLSQKPLVICDTGHNEDGIKSILENIAMTPHRHLHFVLGMMNDKDVGGILQLLPRDNTTYYYCKPDVPRGMPVNELEERAVKFNLSGRKFESVREALAQAKVCAGENDLVFAGGSTFVVAEVL